MIVVATRRAGSGSRAGASQLVVYSHSHTGERPDVPPRVAAGYYVEMGTGEDEYGPVVAAL